MNNFYVYQYLRSKNSKHANVNSPYYVGKGKGKRAWASAHNAKPPKDKSYVVFVAEFLSEADALQLEMFLIFYYGRIDLGTGCLWNMTDGGDGTTGWVCSSATRAKIGSANRGKRRTLATRQRLSEAWKQRKPVAEATKAKIAAALRGKVVSSETKARISAAKLGKKRGPLTSEWRDKVSRGLKGRVCSEATRAKISRANKGRKLGPLKQETKNKLSALFKGRRVTEEQRQKLSIAAKTRARRGAATTSNLPEDVEIQIG